jgi:hypothetical protein
VLALRLIAIFLLAYLVFAIIGILLSSIRARSRKGKRITEHDKEENLVRCVQCQSYVPKAEAIFSHGNFFCRQECACLFERTA